MKWLCETRSKESIKYVNHSSQDSTKTDRNDFHKGRCCNKLLITKCLTSVRLKL